MGAHKLASTPFSIVPADQAASMDAELGITLEFEITTE